MKKLVAKIAIAAAAVLLVGGGLLPTSMATYPCTQIVSDPEAQCVPYATLPGGVCMKMKNDNPLCSSSGGGGGGSDNPIKNTLNEAP